jgi:hypothetical protein
MNPEIKQKWVDALLSGKYDQGSEKLRSRQGYCCLGVLCDLYSQEQNQEWEFRGAFEEENTQPTDYWYFDGEGEFLPESVKEWAGLSLANPLVKLDAEEEDEDPWSYHDEISNLNDTGYTFNDLAKMIQEQF